MIEKPRSGPQHRRFFAMLKFALQYYEPSGGLISSQEERGIDGLARFFEQANGRPGQLSDAVAAYKAQLLATRADRFPAVHKDAEVFRKWALEEAGYFDLFQTPSGIRKVAKSLKFDRMSQEEFAACYAAVFAVLWRFVLRSHFPDEASAESAANQLGEFA